MTPRTAFGLLALTAALTCAPGCGEPSASSDHDARARADALAMTEEIAVKLASADRVDGEEDGVVAQCGGCGLAMEGSPDHALKVGDFSMHFCSDMCRDNFSEDLEASVLALAVPVEDEPEPEEEVRQ